MQRDPKVYLYDILRAIDSITAFVSGKELSDYQADLMLRSAVERQFEIMGEAMTLLARTAPDIAARVGDFRRIIGFRNVLIHRYGRIEHQLVWDTAVDSLPELRTEVVAALAA
jgi:uncharacterized protein with HEPN domain